MPIIEQRNVAIRDRVLHLSDLKSIADYLANLMATDKDRKYTRLEFDVHCADNSSFSGSSPDIFLPDSVIARKRVQRVSMDYRSAECDRSISVELTHGRSDYSNRILVSGNDSRWVNGTISNIAEILDAAKPQNTFVIRNIRGLAIALSVGYGHLMMPLVFFLTNLFSFDSPPTQPIQRSDSQLAALFVFYYIVLLIYGAMPAMITLAKLTELWPSIELQIGPEHTDIERRRRAWLGAAFTAGILPFILSAGYDILKLWWK